MITSYNHACEKFRPVPFFRNTRLSRVPWLWRKSTGRNNLRNERSTSKYLRL
jgi:hypothetical protein